MFRKYTMKNMDYNNFKVKKLWEYDKVVMVAC